MRETRTLQNIDWLLILLYLLLVFIGWFNIYASSYNEEHKSILDFSQNYGKQFIWIIIAFTVGIIILIIDAKFYEVFPFLIYILTILALILVLFFGEKVAHSKSWFVFGSFKLQPSEFSKFATALAIAKYLSSLNIDLKKIKTKIIVTLIIIIPVVFVLLQRDVGTALVFFAFLLVLFREGLLSNILFIGLFLIILFVLSFLVNKFLFISFLAVIAVILIYFNRKRKSEIFKILGYLIILIFMVFSINYTFNNFLEPHHRQRINVLLGKEVDLKGAGYNINQAKIAIGSGGFTGKGFLQGTQTRYDFVPEQSTDFIFCTIGEEWGFIGSFIVIALFIALLSRLIYVAERQRSKFSRIYGYGAASVLFFHFVINIGMTIGLAPVIGIPLPFISYGGSSLLGFTILLFIFIKLDAYRLQILR